MTSIALLVPAFNEAQAMARTALVMREALDAGVVTSATVLDGGSTDGTAEEALQYGIRSLHIPSLQPELGPVLGKGDSLYRVHDIEEVRNFLDVWDVLQGHAELGSDVLLDRSLWRAPTT